MTERQILRLPNPRPAHRYVGTPSSIPRPRGRGAESQGARFRRQFARLEAALSREDPAIELRRDPFGIAPERALVFVTAAPISNFVRAAKRVGLEVLSETDLDETYPIADDLITQNEDAINPTLYATMPTQQVFDQLLRLWRQYQRAESLDTGYAPWRNLFELLAEFRPWGPEDRFSTNNREELESRLPPKDDEEVRMELEHWPTVQRDKLSEWRNETRRKVHELGGRVIDQSSIQEGSFIYDGMLVGLRAGAVRELLDNPSAPQGLAMLDGLQFILPQTIAQSLPSNSEPTSSDGSTLEAFNDSLPFRAILFDGTPIAAHRVLDGGVAIEDIHELVDRSPVTRRHHATSMASLILRGDLKSDGTPVKDSRLLAIPLLVDSEEGAISPDDRLFVDVVHIALQRALSGDEPIAPDVFVINFSIGLKGTNFAGSISSLARLLDWWSSEEGILFVVAAGNIQQNLKLSGTSYIQFEEIPVQERRSLVQNALREQRHDRTLLAPGEALNALTVGATSMDLAHSRTNAQPHRISIQEDDEIAPAISSAVGLGPFRSLKPDVIGPGGHHDIQVWPAGDSIGLRVRHPGTQTGLTVAAAGMGTLDECRSHGTSCATALVTRSLLHAAAALTEPGGPFEGRELPRIDLALLTRALAINASMWPDSAMSLYKSERERLGQGRHIQAAEEVARYFGHGFLDVDLMRQAPLHGATLVGLGDIKKDGGAVFDMPLPPSLAGDSVHRSLLVTLAWFSPVEPTRAKYRLAALEAIAADGDMLVDHEKDLEWGLAMKGLPPPTQVIKRGTVWSRRLEANRVHAPDFDTGTTIPIRVQCRDSSGGGLDQDREIRFAIAVTLQLAQTAQFDVLEEIREQLMVRVQREEAA